MNDEKACDSFPELQDEGIVPRPEPDPSNRREHEQWLREYEKWKNVKCPCGFGYFCKMHGKWIPGAAVEAGDALPAQSQDDGDCPAEHYDATEHDPSERSMADSRSMQSSGLFSAPMRESFNATASSVAGSSSGVPHSSHRRYTSSSTRGFSIPDYASYSIPSHSYQGRGKGKYVESQLYGQRDYRQSSGNQYSTASLPQQQSDVDYDETAEYEEFEGNTQYTQGSYDHHPPFDAGGDQFSHYDEIRPSHIANDHLSIPDDMTEGMRNFNLEPNASETQPDYEDQGVPSDDIWSDWVWDDEVQDWYRYRHVEGNQYEFSYREPAESPRQASRSQKHRDRKGESSKRKSGSGEHKSKGSSSKHKSKSKR